jgi:protein O-GlcNAc transferase
MTQAADPIAAIVAASVAAFSAGRLEEARRGCRWLLAAAPVDPTALMLLGVVLTRLGDAPRGLALLGRALAVAPLSPQVHNTLGNLRLETGPGDAALASYRKAVALAPDFAEARYNLAGLPDPDKAGAERSLRRATALAPGMADAWANLAGACLARPDAAGASGAARRALALVPSHSVAWIAEGNVALRLAQPARAVRADRRVLAATPHDAQAWSNLFMAAHYDPDLGADGVFATTRRWAERAAGSAPAALPRPAATSAAGRRLRVGYLSADLRLHVVARNLEGLIAHHDPAAVEVFFYAAVDEPDALSRWFASRGSWRRISGQSDREAAATIRADGIDILVSLAGLTPGNRPSILLHRPAPVQLSMHDLSSSGLTQVDGWITDSALHPAETREPFTETLLRLPCFYLHAPPEVSPAIRPSPRLAGGPVVFGSFNSAAKLSDAVFDLWARILVAVPDSLLRLGYLDQFGDPALVGRVAARLAGQGVSPTRLLAAGAGLSRDAHLDRLGEIDIALDPFPFNGATTSFEALWMGVPVVTLAGQRFIDRVGVSLLTAIGETELIANSRDDYVARAVALANDPARLIRLRAELRGRVLASPLCDAPAYARAMEALYRDAWRRWGEPRA